MKKILFVTVVLIWASVETYAQEQQQNKDQIQLQEYLMLKDGNMYQVKDQNQTPLRGQYKMQNGAVVNPDGSYQLKDQKQERLQNGECLDMYGKKYKNQQEFTEQMQYRAQAMSQEYLMCQSGQMYRIRNQEKVQLGESFTFPDGGNVSPSGKMQMKDKKQLQLKDGECLDMQGNKYKNQSEYSQQMQYRAQLMGQEYLMVQNGQVFRIKSENRVQLTEAATLQNGTIVGPDGSMQAKDGKQVRLKDGNALTCKATGMRITVVTTKDWRNKAEKGWKWSVTGKERKVERKCKISMDRKRETLNRER
jgi:hypothetical protein